MKQLFQTEVKNKAVIRCLRSLWLFHFLLGLLVLFVGMNRNGGRKFVPANVNSIKEVAGLAEKECQRIYVNVLSNSMDDKDAYICCNELNSNPNLSCWDVLFSSYEYGICSSRLRSLPFVQSLSRFPQSWIIPIIPLLLRIIIILSTIILSSVYTNQCTPMPLKSKLSASMKRLFFYFCMMQFRGWVLYIFMNDIIMKQIVNRMMGVSITAMGKQVVEQGEGEERCWFTKHLRRNHDIECHGQEFDFSDHVVLFYSHFIPIMIIEAIVCYIYPLELCSSSKASKSNGKKQQETISAKESPFMNSFISALKTCLLSSVVVWFIYFNFIVYVSAISTTTYFHTMPESIIGYIISLTVQVPIGLLIMTTGGGDQASSIHRLRCFIGLQLDREHID